MKKLIQAATLLCSLFILSCSTKSNSDPKTVLTDFLTKLSKKDFKGAEKFATESSKNMLEMIESTSKFAPDSNNEYDMANLEIGNASIVGEKATIDVKNKKEGKSIKYTLKKEKGEWRVSFDKQSMMDMGNDSMKNGSSSSENLDSLSDKLNESLDDLNKKLDSLK